LLGYGRFDIINADQFFTTFTWIFEKIMNFTNDIFERNDGQNVADKYHVLTVMATMMSSVRMRAEKEMAMMLMNSTSNISRAPNMITLPKNKKKLKVIKRC